MRRSDSFVVAGFDALPARIAILDDAGDIVYTNESWHSFGDARGLSEDTGGVGSNYLAVCEASDDPDATATARGIRAVAAGERDTFSLEYPCHGPEEESWYMMQATPYEHDDEAYVLVMHIDITERRLLEQRTRDQADRMESFAKLLSHDLRNPLSVALAHAEMLELDDDAALDADDGERSALRSSLERMEAIIDDALVLVTVDEVEETDPLSLATAVETAWANVRTGAATVSVRDDIVIRANASLVSHLFENLFRNAVEHAGDAPCIEIGALEAVGGADERSEPAVDEARREDAGDADWAGEAVAVDGFYVEDDGPGIPATQREQVFESGYSNADGSGFGLAIVRHVADAHGWSVSVTTGRDGGARFEVRGVSVLGS
ncbi:MULTISPECIES: PAS domain-containing sensor histidine kinase [unclassified Natrinema]|uniref:sensor histidine kinase n=1 Tax=unclassified Natrinema TaxID=2622230 RepID=UPI00026D533E|nr:MULTISPECIES: PAS domain-containing sensor histidine kinase [unclassified Natrinema]AFO58206.1 PAS sensor protein [Natrinema sp. J7-2]